jgi:histidinol-phosphate aminotransferase
MAQSDDALRLDRNEHTGGCSPRVIEALSRLAPIDISTYPAYPAAMAAVTEYLGVPADHIILVNGLDEGIMALTVASLRPRLDGPPPEAVIPEPAFEVFRIDAAVAGGRLMQVMPRPDFTFPLDAVLAAITPRTRVVFLSNPNNPTGVALPEGAIQAVAAAVPAGAIVFVDEAYAEFAGISIISELGSLPNVVVGRTFSKAFGLAGLRLGCLVARPDLLARLRPSIPIYSVNVAAAVAVVAALGDRGHLADYRRQVDQSKALLYAACDRLGLRYVYSRANFVLVDAGDRADDLLRGAAERRLYLRDRSNEPGCAGCIRIATGLVAHTKRCIQVISEVLARPSADATGDPGGSSAIDDAARDAAPPPAAVRR